MPSRELLVDKEALEEVSTAAVARWCSGEEESATHSDEEGDLRIGWGSKKKSSGNLGDIYNTNKQYVVSKQKAKGIIIEVTRSKHHSSNRDVLSGKMKNNCRIFLAVTTYRHSRNNN